MVVPPLRSRDDDIEVLARAFLDRHGKQLTLDDSARAALREHDWPGNVRELQSVIEQAAFTAKGPTISRAHLLLLEHRDRATKVEEALRLNKTYKEVHRAIDQWLLPKVLEECKGIIVHAAKKLGMTPKGLRNRMKSLKLYRLEDEEQE